MDRQRARVTKKFKCSICQFMSPRADTVKRHERLIHTVPKKKPRCCGTTFETKGEYYEHCADVHPSNRANQISVTKYGIHVERKPTKSFFDCDTSKLNDRKSRRTRYMLRVRNTPTRSANESLRRKANSSFSTNSTSSSSETSDDDSTFDPSYVIDNNQSTGESSSDDCYIDEQESSSNDENLENKNALTNIDEIRPRDLNYIRNIFIFLFVMSFPFVVILFYHMYQ